MLFVVGVAACGGSAPSAADGGSTGHAGATAQGGQGGAPSGGTSGGGAGAGGDGADAGGNSGQAGGDGGVDAPVVKLGSRRLIGGAVELVGSGTDSCTNQPGALTDRWCAFMRPFSALGDFELWVIDVTKASAGADVRCDGTDAACLRLTRTAYLDPSSGAQIHGFDGDTLIYYADPGPAAGNGFVGPVSAWRPGWATGRKLTSATGVVCSGHKTSEAALCFENQTGAVTGEVSFDLLAGQLPAAGGGPLPKVETLLIQTSADAAGARKFEADLSSDGLMLAWSARPTAGGAETLKVQKLGDASTRQTVATDVSRWEISGDGTHWLWLRGFNYDDAAPAGTLETAPFPGGATPSTLAAGVAEYAGVGSNGVLFRANVAQGVGDLRLMPDRAAPTATQLLDQSVLGVLDHSEDGATVTYAKAASGGGFYDLFVRNALAARPCVLAATPTAAPIGTLLSKNGLVVWAEGDALTGTILGRSTSVASCSTTTFGKDIVRWLPVADEGLVFLDDAAPTGADEATLRAAQVVGGVLPAMGTSLQTRAASVFAPLGPTLPAVVYTVGTTTALDGLYIYVGPPLGAAAAPVGDASATDDATGN